MTPARGPSGSQTNERGRNARTGVEMGTGAQGAAGPMTTERLAEIRAMNAQWAADPIPSRTAPYQVTELLAEIDRLRAIISPPPPSAEEMARLQELFEWCPCLRAHPEGCVVPWVHFHDRYAPPPRSGFPS